MLLTFRKRNKILGFQGRKSDFWDLTHIFFVCPGNLYFLVEALDVLEIWSADNDILTVECRSVCSPSFHNRRLPSAAESSFSHLPGTASPEFHPLLPGAVPSCPFCLTAGLHSLPVVCCILPWNSPSPAWPGPFSHQSDDVLLAEPLLLELPCQVPFISVCTTTRGRSREHHYPPVKDA